jgi:hypothetical protein
MQRSTKAQAVQPVNPHEHTDIEARLAFRRRVEELKALALEEGLRLPLPPHYIATLEALGYVVDLVTGEWIDADGVRYMPTQEAQQLYRDGAL